MKKLALIFAAVAMTPLAACETPQPAPLEQTTIDDVALETSWRTFDAVLDAVNLLIDAGVIEPGSERAKWLAGYIDNTVVALEAAEAAVAAGSSSDFTEAMTNAQSAIGSIRWIIRNARQGENEGEVL